MLRREERRLRRLFGGALLAGALGPLALAEACSSSSGSPGEAADAAGDATGNADAYEGGFSFTRDGGPDTYIDWCEAGPPYLVEAGPDANACEFPAVIPCDLPPLITFIDDAGTIVITECSIICPPGADAGLYTDCNIDNWTGSRAGPLDLSCGVCGLHGGRKPAGLEALATLHDSPPVGDYFARMAHLEAASVHAFAVMRAELAEAGAPRSLVRAAARAERDERRHARATSRLARRFGGVPAAPRVRRTARRSLEAMAVENAVEGCVRETFGALLATWQSRHARDAEVRRAMTGIARDETRHAALAWAFARWAEARLDGPARARVARARREAVRSLDEALTHEPPRSLVVAGLVPSPTNARLMARAVLG